MNISVLIINYNYGRFLAEAIGSALDQTVAPFELVVVDDGSTDESREVLETFSGRVSALLTENRGPTAATNAGLEHCGGDVVCLLDSDDLMLPRRVEALVDCYTAHPECDWVFHGLDFIDRETRSPITTPVRPGFTAGRHDERSRARRRGSFRMVAPATSALSFRRGLLDEVLPIPALAPYQDHFLRFAALGTAPGWVTSDVLCLQGMHDTNMYSRTTGDTRRTGSCRNGVAMLTALDQLGLQMLAEHLAADAVVGGWSGLQLGDAYSEELSSWMAALTTKRKARLAALCAVVAAEAAATRLRGARGGSDLGP